MVAVVFKGFVTAQLRQLRSRAAVQRHSRPAVSELHQIPQISIKVLEDSDQSIVRFLWFPSKLNPTIHEKAIVTPEIVSSQKQEDAPTSLVANPLRLIFSGGTRKEDRTAIASPGSNNHPTLVLLRLISILDQIEPKLPNKERNGFVVVPDDQRDMSENLRHD